MLVFARFSSIAIFVASTLCVACSGSAGDGRNLEDSAGGDANSPPDGGVTIRFDAEPTLEVHPRAERAVVVRVTPPAAYNVRFALLSLADGESHDAALDRSDVVSDTSGRAEVRLIGPSVPTTGLSLRAQVGSVWTSIPITVLSDTGRTLHVSPSYSGHRTIVEWIVSVHEQRCDELGPGIPEDGSPVTRVPPEELAELEVLPESKSVTVRAGQFAAGCANLPLGATDDQEPLTVTASDRPLRLTETTLDVAFALSDDDSAFTTALESGLSLVRSTFRGDSPNDAEALLDAMRATLPANQRTAFDAERARVAFSALIRSSGFQGSASRLSDAINRWARVGRAALLSPRAFEGHLGASPNDALLGELAIDRVGELSADLIDLEVTNSSWAADSSDTLVFGAELSWVQSELVAGLAQGPAIAETGAADVPSALTVIAGCAQIGGALAGAGSAFDPENLETACRTALSDMWQRAATASVGIPTFLQVAATGKVSVGELAQALSVEGSWVGRLTNDELENQTGGLVSGFAPKYAPR